MAATRPNTRALRVGRAAVLSSSSVFVAAVSHFFGGGDAPSLISMVVSTLVALPLVLLFIGRRFHAVRTTLAVALAQGLFHVLFSSLGSGTTAVSGEVISPHAHHMMHLTSFTPLAAESATAAMWVAHGIATVLTVWMLRSGESALLRLARELRCLVLRALTQLVCTQVTAVSSPGARCEGSVTLQQLLRSSRNHRGPPLLRSPSP